MPSSSKIYNAIATAQPFISIRGPSSVAESTLALSSAYTYATSGAAYFFTFFSQETATLTDFYLKVKSYSGTWASTNGTVNVEIREGLNGSNIPGTTLTGSFTVTLDGSTTGWIHASGLSVALTAGKSYCVVVGDSDGGATNFVTLAYGYGTQGSGSLVAGGGATTANGFNTGGTGQGVPSAFVVKVGSILYGGNGFDTLATVTSGTYERGLRFQASDNCTLCGLCINIDTTLLLGGNTFKLYADATIPGGTPLMSYTPPSVSLGAATAPANTVLPLPAAKWTDLVAGTFYRLVVVPLAATTVPRKASIAGSPQADVLAAFLPFGGNSSWTQQNGSVWDDTATAATPLFGPVIVPGGASGGMILSRLQTGM